MIFRYWNTIRYLKFSQIYDRVKKKILSVKVDLSSSGILRKQVGEWIKPAQQSQRMFGTHLFCFLNERHDVTSTNDWNNDQWDKLWLYNLHYFDDLNSIDADKRVHWHFALIQRWIDENPPSFGNGWEPYPSSLRIVNWIKWGLTKNQLTERCLDSLAVQVRYLSHNLETHLLGNHLFANAKALLFTGLFFEGDEADELYQMGIQLIQQELSEQVLEDGGNFELSTMYHLIFLEDLLDLVNIHHAYERAVPEGVEERIVTMLKWLDLMCHPDGEISFFNDAALGVTPSVKEIKNYGVRLRCLLSNAEICKGLTDLPDSGYSRVEIDDAVALIDRAAVGPDYLPGHAHADTLSFELSLFGQRVIVNSGTSVYGIGDNRQVERGTAEHSTVVVDGENSSEVWGGFRVARRARIIDRKQSKTHGVVQLNAGHDGYTRLTGKPVHYREWLFEEGTLSIHDKVTGRGNHEVKSVLPIHPDIKVLSIDENRAVLDVRGYEIVVTVEGTGVLEATKSFYHPEFGMSVENTKLIFTTKEILPIVMTTRISW